MYNEWFEDHKVKTNCTQPCYFVSIAVSKTREQIYKENIIKFYVVFEKFIKVNKAYYLHSAMSIISSVGGFINIRFFNINSTAYQTNSKIISADYISNKKCLKSPYFKNIAGLKSDSQFYAISNLDRDLIEHKNGCQI